MSSLNFDFDVVTGPSLATCSNLPEDPEGEEETIAEKVTQPASTAATAETKHKAAA